MKKIILSICLLFAVITMASAQRAAERKAEISKGLKEQVNLTDVQIASVMAIEDDYRPKQRAIKADANLTDADKKAKSKSLNEEKRAKIESAVGKESAKKVEAFYSSLKKAGDQQKSENKSGPVEQKAKQGGGKKQTSAN